MVDAPRVIVAAFSFRSERPGARRAYADRSDDGGLANTVLEDPAAHRCRCM
jgi:hypothetical protein